MTSLPGLTIPAAPVPSQEHLTKFKVWLRKLDAGEVTDASIEVTATPLQSFREADPREPTRKEASGETWCAYSWGYLSVYDFGGYRLVYRPAREHRAGAL